MALSDPPLTTAQNRLAAYYAAEEAVLLGQSYEVNGRRLSRADLNTIQATIRMLERRVARLSRGGISVHPVTPI